MKNLIFSLSSAFVCLFFMNGCDLARQQNKGQARQPVIQEDLPPVEVPLQPEVPPQDAADNTVLVRAEPGLTGRGNYASANANNPMGIITVPISQYFRVHDRLVLQQIDHAMNLYKAEHGQAPSSHEEFMNNIVRANNLQLPRLPEGHTYVYDPADNQLKVRRPRETP
jgi:hypothetical protein